jgi:uncharacterized protein (UPF0261 family)
MDLIDFVGSQELPERFSNRQFHAHNRLIKSSVLNAGERRETAREIGRRLSQAKGPVHFLLPKKGLEEWDREGGPTHDPDGLAAFVDEARKTIMAPTRLTEIDAHINDKVFSRKALEIFDAWVADGTVEAPAQAPQGRIA